MLIWDFCSFFFTGAHGWYIRKATHFYNNYLLFIFLLFFFVVCVYVYLQPSSFSKLHLIHVPTYEKYNKFWYLFPYLFNHKLDLCSIYGVNSFKFLIAITFTTFFISVSYCKNVHISEINRKLKCLSSWQ